MALAKETSKSSSDSRRSTAPKGYVLCLDNRGYAASLEIGKVYPRLRPTPAVPDGWIRVVDESGEDYLYPVGRFVDVELPRRAKRVLAAR